MDKLFIKQKSRNIAIDGLRGIIALIIALFHFELYVPFGGRKIFSTGYLGVEFFFILSGFLLSKGNIDKAYTNNFSISKNMKEKFIRLYPPYFVSLLALVSLYSFLWFNKNIFLWLNSDSGHITSLISEVFCIQSLGIFGLEYINGPAWYVSALLVTSFILLLFIKYFKVNYIKYISPIICLLCYVALYKYGSDPSSYMFFRIPTAIVRALAGMTFGSFGYFLYNKLNIKLKRMNFFWISIIEVIIFSIFFKMLLFKEESKWDYFIIIPSICIIIILFSNNGIISKALSTQPFKILGKLSYSFYLLQSVCSNFVLNVFGNLSSWEKIAIYLVLNLSMAYLMYFVVENLFHKFILHKEQKSIITRNICLLAIGIFAILILSNYKGDQITNETEVTLTATEEQNEAAQGNEIWIKSIIVDGKWYSAREVFAEGWIEQEDMLGWRIYDQPEGLQKEIIGIFPKGKQIQILFKANKWQGKVKIRFLGQEILLDCYKESENGETLFDLSSALQKFGNKPEKYIIYLFWIVAILLLIHSAIRLYLLFFPKKDYITRAFSDNRKTWADLLHIFCMFQVVLLHATHEGYNSFFSDSSGWYTFLYLNCFTACGFPLFFMISGNFIIRQEENYFNTIWERVKKIIIPLFLWSVVYIVMRKWEQNEEINIIKQIIKIGQEPQYSHLWFIYTLCGVYITSPIISWIYYNAKKKILCYIGVVFGIFPFILKTIETGTGYTINISYIYMLFPEIILFVLGKWISDHKEQLFKKWYLWLVVGFLGYGMVILLSYYYSLRLGVPFKGFFSNYGTVPLFIMYVAIYIMFLQLEPQFSKLNYKMRKVLYLLSESCMDIYFIHMLWYMILEGKNFFGLFRFSTKTSSIMTGVITGIICFLLSFLSSQVIRRSGQVILKWETRSLNKLEYKQEIN